MARAQVPVRAAPSSAVAVVESLLDALRALDIDRAMELFADDVVYQNVPFPPDRGRAQVRRTLTLFTKVATYFEVRVHAIAEKDGVVLTERTDIIRGPGLDLEFWCCGTFEVRDGKIALWRDRFDVGGMALQVVTSPLRSLLRRARHR